MIRTTACSLVLALSCSAPAFAQDQGRSTQAQQQSNQAAQDSAPSGGAAAAAAARTDQAQPAGARDQAMQDPTQLFVTEAYNMNLFEVQLGQLAAQQAQDDQVKQFARTMVQDHTKANQQLKQLAQSANIQIEEQLDPVHQAKLQKMKKLPASEFGRKYMNSQVAGHMMSVLEFQHQSQAGQNPQVKQFATQMLPDLQRHLQHATKLAGQMVGGAQARTASERESGDASSTPGTGAAGQASGQSAGQSGTGAAGQSGPDTSSDAAAKDASQQKSE